MHLEKIGKTYYSYKDPYARVVKKEGIFSRYIHESYQLEFNHLMNSGLYAELCANNLMVKHVTVNNEKLPFGYFLKIIPDQIPFHILPFEWTFKEWQNAMVAFLKINQVALKYGMILKDASPYNFAKAGQEMIMFDTTSFQFFNDGSPWVAYRQFCEEFLGPLALIKYGGDTWARLTRSFIKGMPLDFISNQLPLFSYFNLQCLLHIHIHSKFQPKVSLKKASQKPKGFTHQGLMLLFHSLEKNLSRWHLKNKSISLWNQYYENDLESEFYLSNKSEKISVWLDRIKPTSVTDLGANTGYFTLLASAFSEKVLAIENNVACIEILNHEILKRGLQNITTCVADLTQLSPDLGNGFKEMANLPIRGKSDMVLVLAIIHHLCITFSYSFDQVIELCKQFTRDYLIIEFIPKNDSQTQSLLITLSDIFVDYSESNFEVSLSKSFNILEKVKLSSTERILYLAKLHHVSVE